jgi:hypothetical protein
MEDKILDEILEFTYKRAKKKIEYAEEDKWLEVTSTEVRARDRKLKATWTYEAAQDLRTWHDINSKTLADEMVAEMTAEIDREILKDLRCCRKY